MRIGTSDIQLFSLRRYIEGTARQESLRTWIGNQRPQFEAPKEPTAPTLPGSTPGLPLPAPRALHRSQAEAPLLGAADIKALQQASPGWEPVLEKMAQRVMARRPQANFVPQILIAKHGAPRAVAKKTETTAIEDDMAGLSPEQRLVIYLLERLFGVRVKISAPPDGEAQTESAGACEQGQSAPAEASRRYGWGVEYDLRESYYESENTTFQAAGVVQTADGKEIRFALSLQMSREFRQESAVSLRAGDAVDPLVINFSGTAAQLTDSKFSFDLNADGKVEAISSMGSGSGFLAFDANNDGKINDGKELFGPTLGDGFAELAQHDQDHNQWIDENDPIFSRLRIWQGGAQESAPLATLQQKGVGAIYLGRESTPFAVKDSQNALQGQVVSSGVYLNENGTAGSVQQVDLAV